MKPARDPLVDPRGFGPRRRGPPFLVRGGSIMPTPGQNPGYEVPGESRRQQLEFALRWGRKPADCLEPSTLSMPWLSQCQQRIVLG